MTIRHMLTITIALAIAPLSPAAAQSAAPVVSFDQSQLVAACAAGSCADAAAAVIAGLTEAGLSADALNTQLGFLAAILAEAAKSAPAAAAADYAAALSVVATASSDPTQRAAITQLAETVAAGDADSIDTSSPVGASAA